MSDLSRCAVPADVGETVTETSSPEQLPPRPVVTVIMNTFEHAGYIGRAIQGVVEQVVEFPIELIVSDDCSRDRTREVALESQRRYPQLVRVVTGTTNIGGQRNFRRAVGLARGRYIAFCEGDDFWIDPGKLQRQVSMLDGDPTLGAVHSEFSHLVFRFGRWRTLERFQARFRNAIPQGEVFDDLLRGNFIQTCTLCVRSDFVRSFLLHPLSSRGNPVVDWPLCLFVGAHAKIGYIDTPTATYRKTPGSATNLGPQADIDRARRAMAMIDDFCREFGRPASLAQESHARAHEHILFTSLFQGMPEAYLRSLQWLQARAPDRFDAWRWRLASRLMANPTTRALLARSLRAVHFLKGFPLYLR